MIGLDCGRDVDDDDDNGGGGWDHGSLVLTYSTMPCTRRLYSFPDSTGWAHPCLYHTIPYHAE